MPWFSTILLTSGFKQMEFLDVISEMLLFQMESIVDRMQDDNTGVPVRTVKSFMSKVPSVFTGKRYTNGNRSLGHHHHVYFLKARFSRYFLICCCIFPVCAVPQFSPPSQMHK